MLCFQCEHPVISQVSMTPNPIAASAPLTARALLKQLHEAFVPFRLGQPLAIGIDKHIVVHLPDVNRRILRSALSLHVTSVQYLKAMQSATVRYNLDGSTADEVTPLQRTRATEMLHERFKKQAAARQAQRAVEAAQQKAQEAALQHAEKLQLLSAKFTRR